MNIVDSEKKNGINGAPYGIPPLFWFLSCSYLVLLIYLLCGNIKANFLQFSCTASCFSVFSPFQKGRLYYVVAFLLKRKACEKEAKAKAKAEKEEREKGEVWESFLCSNKVRSSIISMCFTSILISILRM